MLYIVRGPQDPAKDWVIHRVIDRRQIRQVFVIKPQKWWHKLLKIKDPNIKVAERIRRALSQDQSVLLHGRFYAQSCVAEYVRLAQELGKPVLILAVPPSPMSSDWTWFDEKNFV